MGAESNHRLATSCLNAENPQCHSPATPTTFFMATEDNVEQSQSVAAVDDSTFGVKSMESTTANEHSPAGEEVAADGDSPEADVARRRSTLKPRPRSQDTAPGILQTALFPPSGGSSPRKPYRSSPPSASQSLASLSQVSLEPGSSLPSSPKSNSSRSLRPSDEESVYEGGSQAIASSEEDEAEAPSEIQGSSPQLIMPSIKMPSRRPFTVQGKEIGRLKILIAGDTGMGTKELKAHDWILTALRCRQDIINQVYCTDLRSHRPCGSLVSNSLHRTAPTPKVQRNIWPRRDYCKNH